MINRCFPAKIGHYYFSGWLHSCTHSRSPRHGYTFKAICVLAMKSTHAKVCVLHTKSIPDNLTPRYSRSYKPFTERARAADFSSRSALEEKKREWEEKHMHSLAAAAACVWPLMAPIVLRALFNCFSSSQTSFNLLFISCARKALCEGAQIQPSARPEWLQARRDMHSCSQDFELLQWQPISWFCILTSSIVFGSVFLFLLSKRTGLLFFMHTYNSYC